MLFTQSYFIINYPKKLQTVDKFKFNLGEDK